MNYNVFTRACKKNISIHEAYARRMHKETNASREAGPKALASKMQVLANYLYESLVVEAPKMATQFPENTKSLKTLPVLMQNLPKACSQLRPQPGQ